MATDTKAKTSTRRRSRRVVTTSSTGTELSVRAISSTTGADARSGANASRQQDPHDLFHSLGQNVLRPPYDVDNLFAQLEISNTLRPCIESYATNVVSTGWEIEPVMRGVEIDDAERDELTTFIEQANVTQRLESVVYDAIFDRETCGFGFIEVIRDVSGRVSLLRHAPAVRTRLTSKHPDQVQVTRTISRGRRTTVVRELIMFRRFVQLNGAQATYFKEFGDPRPMNCFTGLFSHEAGYVPGFDATEIIHLKLSSPEPYGVPRWISQAASIRGSREAEEVNVSYFRDNTVPPMAVTVSGGRLTRQSFRNLADTLNSNGTDRQHRAVLLEATSQGDSLDEKGTPVEIKIEKLADTRQSDGLFQSYDESNQRKIRMSWRMPAILLGVSADTNYANAQVAVFVAESQVFGPARDDLDSMLNGLLVNNNYGLGMSTCRLKGRIPSINSPETVVKTLTALNVIGAVTPRSAQQLANQILQGEIPGYPERGEDGYEPWMDRPISLSRSGPVSTHAETESKTPDIKETEKTGDPGFSRPENGTEGSLL